MGEEVRDDLVVVSSLLVQAGLVDGGAGPLSLSLGSVLSLLLLLVFVQKLLDLLFWGLQAAIEESLLVGLVLYFGGCDTLVVEVHGGAWRYPRTSFILSQRSPVDALVVVLVLNQVTFSNTRYSALQGLVLLFKLKVSVSEEDIPLREISGVCLPLRRFPPLFCLFDVSLVPVDHLEQFLIVEVKAFHLQGQVRICEVFLRFLGLASFQATEAIQQVGNGGILAIQLLYKPMLLNLFDFFKVYKGHPQILASVTQLLDDRVVELTQGQYLRGESIRQVVDKRGQQGQRIPLCLQLRHIFGQPQQRLLRDG